MHEGHRKRMLERLETAEGSLAEHELLEILLFNAIPRKNTNELAHRLLSAFGSLRRRLRAEMAELKAVPGVGESTAAYFADRRHLLDACRRKEPALPSAFSFAAFRPYLLERFRGAAEEYVELYSLDGRTASKASAASLRRSPFRRASIPKRSPASSWRQSPRRWWRCTTTSKAPPRPRGGRRFHRQLEILCSMHNVALRDHIICSPEGVTATSFRANSTSFPPVTASQASWGGNSREPQRTFRTHPAALRAHGGDRQGAHLSRARACRDHPRGRLPRCQGGGHPRAPRHPARFGGARGGKRRQAVCAALLQAPHRLLCHRYPSVCSCSPIFRAAGSFRRSSSSSFRSSI